MSSWINAPNFDLIRRISAAIALSPVPRNIRTAKIRSHQALPSADAAVQELLDYWGNLLADKAATEAVRVDNPRILQHRDRAHATILRNRTKYPKIFDGLGALHSQKNVTPEAAVPPAEESYPKWTRAPEAYIQLAMPLRPQWQFAATWGVTFFGRLWEWFSLLRWPPSKQPDECILWVELLVAFRMWSGSRLPVPAPDTPGTFILPHLKPTLAGNTVSLGEECKRFQYAVRTLETLHGAPLLPWDGTTCVDARRVLGRSGIKCMGFLVRPWFPLQHEVDAALRGYAQPIRGCRRSNPRAREERVFHILLARWMRL